MDSTGGRCLQRLIKGNRRFAGSRPLHPNQGARRRRLIISGQKPFCAVVCCSDSRVPPELIFDCGLGDLFVVRLAGNVVDNMAIGSLEYAVEHLHIPLIVVMGHSSCGAVSAALSGKKFGGFVDEVCRAIRPAIGNAKSPDVNDVVKINVRMITDRLTKTGPVLSRMVKNDLLEIVPAYYDLKSWKVELL